MKALLIGISLYVSIAGEPVWSAPLPVSEIAEGVNVHEEKHHDFYQAPDGAIANIGFIVGSKSDVVIDTGGSYKIGASLSEAVKTVSDLPIRYVFNTHVNTVAQAKKSNWVLFNVVNQRNVNLAYPQFE